MGPGFPRLLYYIKTESLSDDTWSGLASEYYVVTPSYLLPWLTGFHSYGRASDVIAPHRSSHNHDAASFVCDVIKPVTKQSHQGAELARKYYATPYRKGGGFYKFNKDATLLNTSSCIGVMNNQGITRPQSTGPMKTRDSFNLWNTQ
jgi:hypothetical protein